MMKAGSKLGNPDFCDDIATITQNVPYGCDVLLSATVGEVRMSMNCYTYNGT